MRRSIPFAAGLSAALIAALAAAPGAFANPKNSSITFSCCSPETPDEVYPGQEIEGRNIKHYVFIYADLDNDGVLRGAEIRRAKRRAVIEDHRDRAFR